MNVLGIAGSPRRGGNSEILLDEVLRGAQTVGAEVRKVSLSALHIAPCAACDRCSIKGRCVIDDDTAGLYADLLAADRVVFAAPIFFLGVPAQAKAFIDRSQVLWNKKHVLHEPVVPPGRAVPRKGLFVSIGGTRGKTLFQCAIRCVKSFFDVLDIEYAGDLTFARIDAKGAIRQHPSALSDALEAGKNIII